MFLVYFWFRFHYRCLSENTTIYRLSSTRFLKVAFVEILIISSSLETEQSRYTFQFQNVKKLLLIYAKLI